MGNKIGKIRSLAIVGLALSMAGAVMTPSYAEGGKIVYVGIGGATQDAHAIVRPEDATPPRHRFLATGDPEPFSRLGRRFLGPEVDAVLQAGAAA